MSRFRSTRGHDRTGRRDRGMWGGHADHVAIGEQRTNRGSDGGPFGFRTRFSGADIGAPKGDKFKGINVNILTFNGPQVAEPLQRRAPDLEQLTGAHINVVAVGFQTIYTRPCSTRRRRPTALTRTSSTRSGWATSLGPATCSTSPTG